MAKHPKKPEEQDQVPGVVDTPEGPMEIDILEMEIDENLPHWLHPMEKNKSEYDMRRKLATKQHSKEIQEKAKRR